MQEALNKLEKQIDDVIKEKGQLQAELSTLKSRIEELEKEVKQNRLTISVASTTLQLQDKKEQELNNTIEQLKANLKEATRVIKGLTADYEDAYNIIEAHEQAEQFLSKLGYEGDTNKMESK